MCNHLTRREFIHRGSYGLMGLTMIPSILQNQLLQAFENGVPMDSLSEIYDSFMVTPELIRSVMETALSKGGDYCDLYFQHAIYNEIGLQDDAVNNASSSIGLGLGIRVLKGDQTGYSFSEDLSESAIRKAARTAATIASDGKGIAPEQLIRRDIPNYYPIKTPWEDVSIETKIPILQNLNENARQLDSRIIKTGIRFTDYTSTVLIATSEGRVVHDYRPMGQISLSCTADENGIRESLRQSISARMGIELMSEENLDHLARKTVEQVTSLLKAGKPPAGEMEVVLAQGSAGILLHEAIGHGMEADFNRKGTSIYSDLLNKKVAEPFVTVVDDGTNPNIRGSLNIDDEGNDTEHTVLVDKGILRGYLHDRISARHYGVKPTGNGRRESFRHAPMPRMRNTYMLSGPHDPEEIIASVRNGIYADTFTNGEVHIGAGDFTFYVKAGFLIENGKLTKPIKDINIIGNGPEVLRNITMVGNDLKLSEGGWRCGKNGQSVPVSQGIPTAKVAKVTVGGTAG